MGAISTVVMAVCSSGDHIVTQRQLYAGTQLFFQTACPRLGIDVTFVDGTDPEAFAAAVVPGRTMLVFAETPANPRLDRSEEHTSELQSLVNLVCRPLLDKKNKNTFITVSSSLSSYTALIACDIYLS